jgi:DNA-binding response OmpR family regulator
LLRLLLVEDFELLAEATADFIRPYGLDVRVASTGRHALEIARTFDPDIVLCDVRLPDVSGLDLARTLRASSREHPALIAVLSAMTDVELRAFEAQAQNSAVDLFLCKPLSEQKVKALLEHFGSLQQQR